MSHTKIFVIICLTCELPRDEFKRHNLLPRQLPCQPIYHEHIRLPRGNSLMLHSMTFQDLVYDDL
jgi:hypothetical protein